MREEEVKILLIAIELIISFGEDYINNVKESRFFSTLVIWAQCLLNTSQ